ncbi:H-2 class I histocompatibility antigen, Q10 alpha chain-like [Clinocottus analis]|uniref:H-2 class I histocompatibility antigen, Q10 alpha chain-like n=1 Tax=Clinocottus analis TaxID=304258 RepID=UPI0035BF2F19
MGPVLALLLWGTMAANCESAEHHSLSYIYTAFSRPVELPGIHEFTAMGLLDNKMIDYFDSDGKKKVPAQDWMREQLPKDYWEKGTQSRLSKQQWFKVNINILKGRLRQNDSDVHVLQWRHGCEGITQPNGKIKFTRGTDMYSYDGNDFLSFDDAHATWVAPIDAAIQTKRKWDDVQELKEYTKGYLEKECVNWMQQFLTYQEEQLKNATAPDVYVYTRNTAVEANVELSCMATGFFPKEIELWIKRDERVLHPVDGLRSTGPLPNGDDTFQRRDSVHILRTDKSTYTCEVRHAASGLHLEKKWDHSLPDVGSGIGVGVGVSVGIFVFVILLVVVGLVLYKGGMLDSVFKAGSHETLDSTESKKPLKKADDTSPDGSQTSSLMGPSEEPRWSEYSSPIGPSGEPSGSESSSLMKPSGEPSAAAVGV